MTFFFKHAKIEQKTKYHTDDHRTSRLISLSNEKSWIVSSIYWDGGVCNVNLITIYYRSKFNRPPSSYNKNKTRKEITDYSIAYLCRNYFLNTIRLKYSTIHRMETMSNY